MEHIIEAFDEPSSNDIIEAASCNTAPKKIPLETGVSEEPNSRVSSTQV